MTFHIVTLFPNSFSYLNESILKRAQKRKKISVKIYNLRDFTKDKHKTADDKPYGGGAGMVLKAPPILKAVCVIKSKTRSKKLKIILLSAKGKQFNQKIAQSLAKNYKHIIFIAGRYEGADERVKAVLNAEEISIGPYVLTDGEVASMVIISSVTRLVPGVITLESLQEESHFNLLLKNETEGKGLEYPHYTRPEVLTYKRKKYCVPKVLLSGNHKRIAAWREAHRQASPKRILATRRLEEWRSKKRKSK